MTHTLPPLPEEWRRVGDAPDDSYLGNLALQLAHRADFLTLPWLFGAWAVAFAALTPTVFGGHPAAWVGVGLFAAASVGLGVGAVRLRRRWRGEGLPLEYATPWPRTGYSDRVAMRSLARTAVILVATTVFIAIGGSSAGLLTQALPLAGAVLAFAVTLTLPGVWFRRRRFVLLADAVAAQPDAIPRLQAALDASARATGAGGVPFAPAGFAMESLGLH